MEEEGLVEPTAASVAAVFRQKAGPRGFDMRELGEYLAKRKPFVRPRTRAVPPEPRVLVVDPPFVFRTCS